MPTALANMPIDEATGFIDSPQLNGFGIDAKRQFVKLMCETKGDASITAMAEALGFDPATVLRHIQIDKAFAQQIQEAKTLFAHRVEGVLMSSALDPKKTLDRLAYLRAYMPERYARMELLAPASNIQITVNGSVSTKLNEVVDAELVTPESASITQSPTNNTLKAPCTIETIDSQ